MQKEGLGNGPLGERTLPWVRQISLDGIRQRLNLNAAGELLTL